MKVMFIAPGREGSGVIVVKFISWVLEKILCRLAIETHCDYQLAKFDKIIH